MQPYQYLYEHGGMFYSATDLDNFRQLMRENKYHRTEHGIDCERWESEEACSIVVNGNAADFAKWEWPESLDIEDMLPYFEEAQSSLVEDYRMAHSAPDLDEVIRRMREQAVFAPENNQ